MISARFPDWLRRESLLQEDAPACYRIDTAPYRFYFVAANELPLRAELLPFLVARSGSALVEFGKWLLQQEAGQWLEWMLEVIPMTDAQFDEISAEIPQPSREVAARRKRTLAQRLAEHTGLADDLRQEGRNEGLKQGAEQGRSEGLKQGAEQGALQALSRVYAKRLGRPLREDEQQHLSAKLAALGHDRLSEVLFELAPEALSAWLVDPAAR
jgi:hypothetical protein